MGTRQPARRSSRGSKRGGSDRARQPSPSGHRASVLGRIERCCAYMRTTRRTLSLSARPWPARARTLKLSRVCCVPKSQNLNRGRDVLHRGRGLPAHSGASATSNDQAPTSNVRTCNDQRASVSSVGRGQVRGGQLVRVGAPGRASGGAVLKRQTRDVIDFVIFDGDGLAV